MDFPINSMVMFHSYVNVYQRVVTMVILLVTIWLVVEPALLKNISQLGWWHSQYDGKNNPNVPNHQPDNIIEIIIDS